MATRLPRNREDFAAEPRSVDLRDYWLVIRRRRALVLVSTLLGAVIGAAYALGTAPTYTATSEVVVTPVTQGPLNQPTQANPQVNISTEQVVAQSAPVIERAAKLLHTPSTTLQAEASKHLAVNVPALSNLLQITWQAGSAKAAQQGANAFANAYLQYHHDQLSKASASLAAVLSAQVRSEQAKIAKVSAQLSTEPAGTSLRQSLDASFTALTQQLNTTENQLASLPTYNESGGSVIPAAKPLAPSGLGHAMILGLGTLLGLLIGLVLAFIRDVFDDRVRDTAQLESALGAATLAVLPRAKGRLAMPGEALGGPQPREGTTVATVTRPGSRAEAVRALRATLVAVGTRQDVRTILIAEADGCASSSGIVAEVGVTIAETGRTVLLVGADLRGSSLAQIFDVPNTEGLSSLLTGGGDPEVLTCQPKSAGGDDLQDSVAKRLALLPNGPEVTQPLAVLDSSAMVGLLKSQRDAYEFVLLDSPSANAAADVVGLAAHVDGVIVVAHEARARGRVLKALRQHFDQVGAHVIGGVFIRKGGAARRQHRHDDPLPVARMSIANTERRARQAGTQGLRQSRAGGPL